MKKTSKIIIDSEFIDPPEGITVTNWVFDGEPIFKHKERTKPLKHLVIHETAGRSASGCKRTLKKKGSGVIFIVARNGSVSQHGDPITDRMVHANHLNNTSIGIEFVNPYAPKLAKGMPHETIDADWWTWCPDKEDRRYVLPTPKQMRTLELLVPFLCEHCGIPYEFPTADLNKKKRQCERVGWQKKRTPGSGVVAHQDFSKHGDGRYLLEHLIKLSKPE